MPGAMFRNLACAAGDHVLVALAAALRVVRGPETVGDLLHFLEDEPIVVERTKRYDVVFVQLFEVGTLRIESVREVVEADCRFRSLGRRRRRVVFILDVPVFRETLAAILIALLRRASRSALAMNSRPRG